MAQMQTPSAKQGKRDRKTLFVDLTPMVDLAFLLISFFMLTTIMTRPGIMQMNMPIKGDITTDVINTRVITLIGTADDKIWYYRGLEMDSMCQTDLSAEGIREVLYAFNKHVKQDIKIEPICLIKFNSDASYNCMVELLDEMDITDVRIYAIQDMTNDEKAVLEQKRSIARVE